MRQISTSWWLSSQEYMKIERRGFFVKENFTFFPFFKSSISILILSGLITWLISVILIICDNIFHWLQYDLFAQFIPYVGYVFWIICSSYLVYYYSLSSHTFHSSLWSLWFWVISSKVELENKNEKLSFFSELIRTIGWILKYISNIRLGFRNNPLLMLVAIVVTAWIMWLYLLWLSITTIIQWMWFPFEVLGWGFIWNILVTLIPMSVMVFLWIIGNLINKVYNPLYAFWNLWSKIQSLTPRISESSDKIQNEFSTDMNFSVLSKGFATLASDFSKISGYVLKLEQIEKKANKWNLFDSEKYIGSLREDILTPLKTLKKFLEQKKIELEASREEFKNIQNQRQRVQVQVGWLDTLTGNADLQSKRTEPLIHELTENIDKLGVMIGKFS